ncbi:hypothetical protein [Micromonospora sp. DT47]|uniref:hypothetical protein n=1 Tax=Micromonospora sp. DT47 TaxID=3393431 RepID=UPI003CEBA459
MARAKWPVVGGALEFPALPGEDRHDVGVDDERVERAVPRRDERVHRRQVGQVERGRPDGAPAGSAPRGGCIAHAVGYGSESALSVAFSRTAGVSPRVYRAQAPRADLAGRLPSG